MVELGRLLVIPNSSIRDVMVCIDRSAKGIALIVDADRRLLGTVTDGDIRRAILAGMDLDKPVQKLLEQRSSTAYPHPIVAKYGTSDNELIRVMNEHSVRHIPLLDGNGRVAGIALLSDLIKEYELPLKAVVMAGGYGTRLRPLTDELPKPMMSVGDRPLLELIIQQLREAGISRVNVTTHYKKEMITQHFGDGKDFGVEISYVEEKEALGTAGALSLLDASEEPLLVINGDILTRVDFRAMLHFHRDHKAEMTVGVRQYEFKVPYGLVETDEIRVTSISEKPILRHFINAGIYLLNPDVCRLVPKGEPYDMPELINHLIKMGHRVVSFPVREHWLDIGQIEDYQKAQSEFENS